MINVQRVSARTTRMHSFLIFNMDTRVGAIWPSKPSSIVSTSCFISSRSFSAKGTSPLVCYLGFLNGCHWTCLDCTAVFVSDVYLYEVFAPPHYSCMYPLVQGEGQEIDKKHTLAAVSRVIQTFKWSISINYNPVIHMNSYVLTAKRIIHFQFNLTHVYVYANCDLTHWISQLNWFKVSAIFTTVTCMFCFLFCACLCPC